MIKLKQAFIPYLEKHRPLDLHQSYISKETCGYCSYSFSNTWSIDGGPSPAWRPFRDNCPACHKNWQSSVKEDNRRRADKLEFREWMNSNYPHVNVEKAEIEHWWEWVLLKAVAKYDPLNVTE